MPHRPHKPCASLRCKNLVTKERYCPDHIHLDTSKFRNKKGKTHPWYYQKFWKDLRALKKTKNPLCEYCEAKGKLTPVYAIDHIQDWKKGKTEDEQWRLFSDWDNLASACESCHNSKTGRTNK